MVFFGVFVILLLLGGIIGWLFKVCWGGSIEKVCYLFLFIVVFGVFWLFIGSGIFWYGFLMLVILMVFFVYGVQFVGFEYKNIRIWVVGVILVVYILMSYVLVFIFVLQFFKNVGFIYQELVLCFFGEGFSVSKILFLFKFYLGEVIDYIN